MHYLAQLPELLTAHKSLSAPKSFQLLKAEQRIHFKIISITQNIPHLSLYLSLSLFLSLALVSLPYASHLQAYILESFFLTF